MEEYLGIFTKYIKDNYDTDNQLIRLKYFHSLEVAKLMLKLGKDLELNEEDLNLAFFIGLTHDLGRFYEIKNKGRMNNLTFDHGAYSVKILYNDNLINRFNINESNSLIIKKALYFHGKKDINKNVNEREALFCNLLRDADKLDILRVVSEAKREFNELPTGYFIRNYMNDLNLDLHFRKNRSDSVILYLSFIKDLFFNESYNYAIENKVLDNFIKMIDVSSDNQKLFDILVNKVKKRGEENVREKVRTLKR